MIRAVAVVIFAIVLVSGVVIGGQRLLAGADRAEEPVILHRFDDGSMVLSYNLEDDQVLVFVVDAADGCRSYAIAGPAQNEVAINAGTSVSFTVTDPAGEQHTRAWLMEQEC